MHTCTTCTICSFLRLIIKMNAVKHIWQLSLVLMLGVVACSISIAIEGDQQAQSLKLVGPDGRLDDNYTTWAYRQEALKLIIQEANRFANDLNLRENLPISESNLVFEFIPAFGIAARMDIVGRITVSLR